MTKIYKPALILHWQEKQEGFYYYGGFLGLFKQRSLKPNTHHSKEITKEDADFIVKNMPRLEMHGSPTVLMNIGDYNAYEGTFYAEGFEFAYIEKRIPKEVQGWIDKLLDK